MPACCAEVCRPEAAVVGVLYIRVEWLVECEVV